MDYEKFVKLLAPICDEKSIFKVFQFGSRVWGTASPNADWDFFVVIDGYTGCVHPELDLSLAGCQVDISAYNVLEWKSLLSSCDMLALVCEYLPSQFRWKDTYDPGVEVALKTLVRGISKETAKCLSQSWNHYKNGDRRTSIKNFVHATRYLGFAHQIASFNKIVDLGVSNERLHDAMRRLENETDTYETWNAFYRPQINALLTEFQDMVQRMIMQEMEHANVLLLNIEDQQSESKKVTKKGDLETRLEMLKITQEEEKMRGSRLGQALVAYLDQYGLHNLHRFFCVHVEAQAQFEDAHRFLLKATFDSPEDYPFIRQCGATLVELNLKTQKFKILASPRPFVESVTLDSLVAMPQDVSLDNAAFYAIEKHIEDCEVVLWYDFQKLDWSCYCVDSRLDIAAVEASFRSNFVALGLDYPDDKGAVVTWFYNVKKGTLRAVDIFGVSKAFRSQMLSGGQMMTWPKFDLKRFDNMYEVQWYMSELEVDPLAWHSLYFPGGLQGLLILSRTKLAFDRLVDSEVDSDEEGVNAQLHRQYCTMALCLARNDPKNEIWNKMPSPIVRSEVEMVRAIESTVDYFWSLVQNCEDNSAFFKRVNSLKLWKPVISVLQAIRQHPSQNPRKILYTSAIRVYQHWKEVFEPAKIAKLVEIVKKLVSSPSATSSSAKTD